MHAISNDAINRPGRGLRNLVGEVRHELDEQRAEERARDSRDAADDDADDETDRQEQREAVGRDELRGERAERARDPGKQRADAEGQRLIERRVDPHAGRGDGIVADRHDRAAGAGPQQVVAEDEHRHRDGETKKIEPPVGIDRHEARRIGLGDKDALNAAGPTLDAVEFQELGRRHGEREGRERKVRSIEPQRRQAEQKSGDEADRGGEGNGRPIGHPGMAEQNRRGIGAERIERAVAERDLPVVAGENVGAEHRNRVIEHHGELEDPITRDEKRQRHGKRQRRGDGGHAPIRARHGHTRVTTDRPNRPDGLTTSTPMMTRSATLSFNSVPTT